MTTETKQRVGDIIRGKFVYKGGLSGRYYVGNARKVVSVHDDGSIAFSVVGQKWDVTEDVVALIFNNNHGSPKVGDIIRGKFIYKGGLSGRYYVGNARKVVSVHDDGSIAFSVVGRKWDVTEDVVALIDEAREVKS